VAAGNPAKVICSTEAFLEKKREEMNSVAVFSEEYTVGSGITDQMKKEMNSKVGDGIGYVV